MASRMQEDPLIKIHSESSKEHHIEASTCLTMIFEQVIKAVPPPLRPSNVEVCWYQERDINSYFLLSEHTTLPGSSS